MPFQIKEIVLYSGSGDRRRLRFNVNRVNIITGKSGTGKSAIVPILDYCLGRTRLRFLRASYETKSRGMGSFCK